MTSGTRTSISRRFQHRRPARRARSRTPDTASKRRRSRSQLTPHHRLGRNSSRLSRLPPWVRNTTVDRTDIEPTRPGRASNSSCDARGRDPASQGNDGEGVLSAKGIARSPPTPIRSSRNFAAMTPGGEFIKTCKHSRLDATPLARVVRSGRQMSPGATRLEPFLQRPAEGDPQTKRARNGSLATRAMRRLDVRTVVDERFAAAVGIGEGINRATPAWLRHSKGVSLTECTRFLERVRKAQLAHRPGRSPGRSPFFTAASHAVAAVRHHELERPDRRAILSSTSRTSRTPPAAIQGHGDAADEHRRGALKLAAPRPVAVVRAARAAHRRPDDALTEAPAPASSIPHPTAEQQAADSRAAIDRRGAAAGRPGARCVERDSGLAIHQWGLAR